MDLYSLTLHALRELIIKKEITAKDAAFAYTRRIGQLEGSVNAYLTLTPNKTIAMADDADHALSKGKTSALLGIPLAIKDNMCTKGVKTTCASKMLADFVPPYESTVTSKLTDAGYVMLGKTNMDEFAMGSSTENSAYEATKNPWDLERIPGGSSGGSAAAVAADLCAAALGSDTGGSIRQPASCCGVVGLKPTYGRVSRYGLVAFASSLDQIGPITKDVEDCAIMMNVIGGHDPLDSTSANVALPDFTANLKGGIKGLKVGMPKEYFVESGIDKEVYAAMMEAIVVLQSLGAEVKEISLPHTDYAIATYYILATSEASFQPGALRRREVRIPGERTRGPFGHVQEDPLGRLRPGGEAPDNAWDVRAVLRLLRRVLQEGPAGAHADQVRFRYGVQGRGHHNHPDRADARVQAGREDRRPAPDVPKRHLHHKRKPGRHPRPVAPLRHDKE